VYTIDFNLVAVTYGSLLSAPVTVPLPPARNPANIFSDTFVHDGDHNDGSLLETMTA